MYVNHDGIIMVGDVNLTLLRTPEHFATYRFRLSLDRLVTQPMRYAGTTSSLIDNAMCFNSNIQHITVEIIDPLDSTNHMVPFCEIGISLNKRLLNSWYSGTAKICLKLNLRLTVERLIGIVMRNLILCAVSNILRTRC